MRRRIGRRPEPGLGQWAGVGVLPQQTCHHYGGEAGCFPGIRRTICFARPVRGREEPGINQERFEQEERKRRGPPNPAQNHRGHGAGRVREVPDGRRVSRMQVSEYVLATIAWKRSRDEALDEFGWRRIIQPVCLPHCLPQFPIQSLPQISAMLSPMRLAMTADSCRARSPRASRR